VRAKAKELGLYVASKPDSQEICFVNDNDYGKFIEENTDNYEELMNEPGLKGLFVRKMFSLIDKAENEKEKHLLMKAMQYGVEALEQGKVEVL